MVNYQIIAERLQKGEIVTFHPHGHSMTPYIKDGQEVTVRPYTSDEQVRVGDIVLAKVHGTFYLHIVKNIDVKNGRYQIGNAHGRINGWTTLDKVYGLYTWRCSLMVKALPS